MRHAVENVLSGEYRSAFRGRGMEFDQVVKYEFGDDVRDIDWNVTARLGEPYRKKFVEEREVTLLLVFEDSPSLQFGSVRPVQARGAARAGRAGDAAGRRQPRPRGLRLRRARRLSCEGAGARPRPDPARRLHPARHAAAGAAGNRRAGYRRPETEPTDTGLLDRSLGEAVIRYPQSEIPWQLLARAAPKHSILIWLSDFPPREAPEAGACCSAATRPWASASTIPGSAPFRPATR